MDNNEFKKAEVFVFSNRVNYADAAIVSKNVLKNSCGNVSLFAFEKGEGLSEHTAPYDALVQVIDGKAEVVIDGKPFAVREGESVIMPANIPHALKALERFKMILTMIRG